MASKRKQSDVDNWLNELTPARNEAPQLVPAIGVEITARFLVKEPEDWQYVEEALEKCREYGAAEVDHYEVLDR